MFGILWFAVPLCFWVAILFDLYPLLLCTAFIITALFAWIWFGTIYRLEKGYLIYHSGPMRGKIPINNIKEINHNIRAWVGMRPALSFRYMQIRYNKYDDLFIAPKMEEQFVEELKGINPQIIVKNKKHNQALNSDG